MKEKIKQERYFTDRELEIMILAVAKGQEEFSEADVEKLYDWVLETYVDSAMAHMILQGKISVDTRGAEFTFRNIKD